MSKFSGKQGKGAMRSYRLLKHEQAEERHRRYLEQLKYLAKDKQQKEIHEQPQPK